MLQVLSLLTKTFQIVFCCQHEVGKRLHTSLMFNELTLQSKTKYIYTYSVGNEEAYLASQSIPKLQIFLKITCSKFKYANHGNHKSKFLHKLLETKKMGKMQVAKKILTDVHWISVFH